jgi:hypothetical protein
MWNDLLTSGGRLARTQLGWGAVAALLAASLAGALVVLEPTAGVAAVAALSVLAFVLYFNARLPGLFLAALGVCLFGYTFLGKGFAYFGVAPLFVGELLFGVGLLAAAVVGLGPALRSPVIWLLLAYAAWGAARTLPYLGTYGLEALRDATVWGYSAFAVFVASFVLRLRAWAPALAGYGRWFWWFAFWSPVAGVIFRVAENSIPRVPGAGDIPVLFVKAGDFGVQLAGIATFVLVGLAQRRPGERPRPAWLDFAWWAAWLAGLVIAGSASRGGMLSVFVAVFTVLVLRPHTRWWKPAVVTILFAVVFTASDVSIDVGQERKVSASQIVTNLRSIVGGGAKQGNLDNTRAWRLAWWNDIIGYTVHGPYFWTGKGFGVNLADDDGYQGTERGIPNRSPHNVELTVLARAGVPGLVLWTLLQGTFALSLLVAYRRARRLGLEWWARVDLWVLAYWLAFMVNAAFDVYLEGPQGGIWFWSLIGFGVAALEAQRRPQEVAGAAGGRRGQGVRAPRATAGIASAPSPTPRSQPLAPTGTDPRWR